MRGRALKAGAAILLAGIVGAASPVLGSEKIVTNAIFSEIDKRENYPHLLLKAALDETSATHGGYEIVDYGLVLQRQRALLELERGSIDIYATATQREWESRTLPVRVPLRKGILGYRLFLIDGRRQSEFSEITRIFQLRRLTLGSGAQWSITKAFKRLRFNVHTNVHYEALFRTLLNRDYDYFPRGVNEIFHEFSDRSKQYPDLAIEQDLALFIPLPSYFFVSPNKPELQQRLQVGMEAIVANGVFEQLFQEYHGPNLERAGLQKRRVFELKNPDLTEETPLDRDDLWYRPGGS